MKTWIVPAFLLLFASACNVNVQDGSNPVGANYIPIDSGTTVVTHSESHSSSKGGFEIKGGFHSESHSSTHITTKVEKTKSLVEQVDAWQAAIFMNFEAKPVVPGDEKPKFQSAKETVFRTLQRRTPIKNAYNKSVKPNVLLKAYRFESPTKLALEVEKWLNTLGSSQKQLELGQNAPDSKSLPTVCGVVGNDFVMVESICANEGNEWFFTKELFFATLEEEGAGYTWETKCGDGEIAYVLGGSD